MIERRRVIDELGLRVIVEPTRPGRRPFDPDSVRFEWLDEDPQESPAAG